MTDFIPAFIGVIFIPAFIGVILVAWVFIVAALLYLEKGQ